MGRHGEAKKNFLSLFPNVAREEPGLFERYRDVNDFLSQYLTTKVKKEIPKASVFDLAGTDRKASEDLIKALKKSYPNESTQSSNKNHVNKLIGSELSYIVLRDVVTPEMAALNAFDPEKLLHFMKEIWLAFPRQGANGLSRVDGNGELIDSVVSLPLINPGYRVFAALLEVVNLFEIKDKYSLLVARSRWVTIEVKKKVFYEEREAARRILEQVRRKFQFRTGGGYYSSNCKDIPPKILKAGLIYVERAEKGYRHYPELKPLAEKAGLSLDPHAPQTIKHYFRHFIAGVRKLKLPSDATLDDILVLEPFDVIEQGKVVGQLFHSPSISKLQQEEQDVENPGHKSEGADSAFFRAFMSGFLSVCRFNGIFFAAAALAKTIDIKLDTKTLEDQRFWMKDRMNLEWLDGGISKSVEKFNELVDTRQFLFDEKALIICCGLPQLMTLRFLGYRQECIRMSELGKNVFFGAGDSVRYHFERYEIKNGVPIDQQFVPEQLEGMKELLPLIGVLNRYRYGVLSVFEQMYPDHYRTAVGKRFYVMPVTDDDGRLVIQGFPSPPQGLPAMEVADIEKASTNLYYNWFQIIVEHLLDLSVLVGCEYSVFPHFLRAQCCQWMRDNLGWDWDRIEVAMGDLQKTLQKFYYSRGLRRQTATPFIETSKERLAAKEVKSLSANSVSLETHQAVNQSLVLVTEDNKTLRQDRQILQTENIALRDERATLHERLSKVSAENAALREMIDAINKTG